MGGWLLPWASWPKPPARNVTSHPKRWETRTAPDPPRDQGFILPDAAKTASTPPHLDIAGRALCTKLKNAAHHFWWLLDPHRVWARCPQNVACAARPTGGMCAPPAAGLLRRPDAYRSYPRPFPERLCAPAYASRHAYHFKDSGWAPVRPFRAVPSPIRLGKNPAILRNRPGQAGPRAAFSQPSAGNYAEPVPAMVYECAFAYMRHAGLYIMGGQRQLQIGSQARALPCS